MQSNVAFNAQGKKTSRGRVWNKKLFFGVIAGNKVHCPRVEALGGKAKRKVTKKKRNFRWLKPGGEY